MSLTVSREKKLIEILKELPESAVEHILSYADFLRQIYEEGDKLDRLAEERFIELCRKKGISYKGLDDEEVIRMASELIHQRRRREAQSSS